MRSVLVRTWLRRPAGRQRWASGAREVGEDRGFRTGACSHDRSPSPFIPAGVLTPGWSESFEACPIGPAGVVSSHRGQVSRPLWLSGTTTPSWSACVHDAVDGQRVPDRLDTGYDVRLLSPGGRPVRGQGCGSSAGALSGVLAPSTRSSWSAATDTGAARPTTCSSRTSGGLPGTRAGWRRCAPGRRCWPRPGCWTAAVPPRTGHRRPARPRAPRRHRRPGSDLRPRRPCRDVGRSDERSGPHPVVRRRGSRSRRRAAGGQGAGHLHAAPWDTGSDEHARRGAGAGARRRARRRRACRPAP